MAKKKSDYKKLIVNTLRQKYPYFFLGLSLLVVSYLIVINFITPKNLFPIKKTAPTPNKTKEISAKTEKKYSVKQGDHLWQIAEKTYGSGYYAYDIASANKITNPNIIIPGQELILPTITPQTPNKGEVASAASSKKVTIKESKYLVQPGDSLWKIALTAYGDGYAWVKIAAANKLTNPDIIHPGNILIVPK